MEKFVADCAWPLGAELGEGPLWMPEHDRVYFVSLKGRALHALNVTSGEHFSWGMPDYLCWLVARRDGDGFVAGLRDGVVRLWLEPELRIEYLHKFFQGHEQENLRLNDAKVDARGRVWFGSMHNLDYSRNDGALYRLDADHSLHQQDQGYHICNGPAFSSDGHTMYHTDSYLARIYAYPIDADGELGARQVWRQFDDVREGSPDGMTIDSEGCLWIAQWGGGRVCRYNPSGELLTTIRLPVSQPTSCTFAGPDLKTLYITSAHQGLTPVQRAHEPLAGALFKVEVEVAGLPSARFGQA